MKIYTVATNNYAMESKMFSKRKLAEEYADWLPYYWYPTIHEIEVENELHSLLYVPKDSELVQKLTKVYCEETGDMDAKPIAIGGGTYAKSFDNMVAFGPIFPGEEEVIHAPNEYANMDNLVRSIQITAAAMYELAQK